MATRRVSSFVFVVIALASASVQAGGPLSVSASSDPSLATWSSRVERLVRSGELVSERVRPDTMIPGRTHERLAQLHRGVPVFGGALLVQSDAAGPLTVFGTYYEDIAVDVSPRLTARDVMARIAERGGQPSGRRGGPELLVLPLDSGEYRLAWRVRAFFPDPFDIRQTFYDAVTGDVLLDYTDLRTQVAGIGTGVLGDRKKISVARGGAGFVSSDRLRPPALSTYDFRFNLGRFTRFLDIGPSDLTSADFGSDSDNDWTDGALVDAHVYAGYTYDFYYKRFGRRGLDDHDVAIHSIVHVFPREEWSLWDPSVVGTFYTNAIYMGDGVMYYGEGLPSSVTMNGQHWNYMSGALDVVAHELSHGVLDYSAGLEYRDMSGALNEAFADVMATSAEFLFQPEKADYMMGEDVVTPAGLRSLQNPVAYGYPDDVFSYRSAGPAGPDNGYVHYNSTIPSHTYYLAVEGGPHRLGAVVHGVGRQNREQIDRIWYRTFTYYLPPSTSFCGTRAAMRQAARDLYGVGSAPERAVEEAWDAVRVNGNCGFTPKR